jgi:hypothetical protein
MEEIELNSENFNKYFFDVRKHKPQKGQIMVCYAAMADLVNSPEKASLVDLLINNDKALAATQVMRKLFLASDLDSIQVPIKIAEDLHGGMSIKEVMEKKYRYRLEMFFYTLPEHVPQDPHWTTISILNLNEFVDTQDGVTIKSKFVGPKNESIAEEDNISESE